MIRLLIMWLVCCSVAWAGGSRDFSSDYLDLGNTLEQSLPISLMAWTKFDAVGSAQGVVTNDQTSHVNQSGVNLTISSGAILVASFQDNTACASTSRRTKTGTTAITTGTWHHLVAIHRGAEDQDLYLNGVDDGGTYSGTGGAVAYRAESGAIGKIADCPLATDSFTDGKIAYAMLFDKSLTAQEVSQTMFAPLTVPSNVNQKASWPIWGVNSPELDLSGNGIVGTVVGAVESTDGPPIFHPGSL